jgi:hypothetical protein
MPGRCFRIRRRTACRNRRGIRLIKPPHCVLLQSLAGVVQQHSIDAAQA